MKSTPLRIVVSLVLVVLVCAGAAAAGAVLFLPASVAALSRLAGQPVTSPAVGAPAVARSILRVGDPAPDFSLSFVDGRPVQLSQYRGKVVLINFWATWCGPCTAEMPRIEKAFQQHASDPLMILAVNQGESAKQVQGFAEIYRLTFPLVLDQKEQAGSAYRVQAFPTTFFVDRAGILREIHVGEMSQDYLDKELDALLR